MSEANEILGRFRSAYDHYQRDLGAHQLRQRTLGEVMTQQAELSHKMEVRSISIIILEAVSLQAQDLIKEKIDAPVTTALRTIYQDHSLAFVTELERVADRMEADFRFKRGENYIPGPILDSEGGGLINVAGFTLRLCLYQLLNGRGPLGLDEPFREVDEEALPRAAEFAHRVAVDMGIQIVAVSHERALADLAGNIIEAVSWGVMEQREVGGFSK